MSCIQTATISDGDFVICTNTSGPYAKRIKVNVQVPVFFNLCQSARLKTRKVLKR